MIGKNDTYSTGGMLIEKYLRCAKSRPNVFMLKPGGDSISSELIPSLKKEKKQSRRYSQQPTRR